MSCSTGRCWPTQGIGVWPDPLKEDFEKAASLDIRAALTAWGYTPHDDLKTVLTAFQRHFHPEIFKTPEKVGQADMEDRRPPALAMQNLKLSGVKAHSPPARRPGDRSR